jgi:hypothetical protein
MNRKENINQMEETPSGSLKNKIKLFLVRGVFSVIFGLILMGIGIGVAILIANKSSNSLPDVMFMEGIVVLVIGILASMKGNPSGGNISRVGMNNPNLVNFMDLETTRIERETTNYYDEFRKHAIVEFGFSSITLIFGGVFLILVSILFFH